MVNFQDFFKKDLDDIFAYKTEIEVEILDRYLGILKLILQTLILGYIFIVNL